MASAPNPGVGHRIVKLSYSAREVLRKLSVFLHAHHVFMHLQCNIGWEHDLESLPFGDQNFRRS